MNVVNSVNRDVFVGEVAKDLYDLEEITLFGFAYWENGKIQYYFSENEAGAFTVQQNEHAKSSIMTPIEKISLRSAVIPATKAILISELQEILQQKYSEDYFLFLAYFNALASFNQAQLLIEEYLGSFSGGEPDAVRQAGYNLVNLAYYAKKLDKPTYLKFIKLIDYHAHESIQSSETAKFRQMSGIGYIQPSQTVAYYCNAYLPNVFKQKVLLEKRNCIVSPIFHLNDNLLNAKNSSPKKIKEDFYKVLTQTIDGKYMNTLQKLNALASTINHSLFYCKLDKIKSSLTYDALNAVDEYAKLWGISKEE
ncbi:MAG: hypothetical protein AAGU27_04785 [Dehalobacterium sp.]